MYSRCSATAIEANDLGWNKCTPNIVLHLLCSRSCSVPTYYDARRGGSYRSCEPGHAIPQHTDARLFARASVFGDSGLRQTITVLAYLLYELAVQFPFLFDDNLYTNQVSRKYWIILMCNLPCSMRIEFSLVFKFYRFYFIFFEIASMVFLV